jgi:phosphatidylglycerophosphate synthase
VRVGKLASWLGCAAVRIFIDASEENDGRERPIVFGMSLVERLLRGTREVGVVPEEVCIALAPGESEPSLPKDIASFAPLSFLRDVGNAPEALTRYAASGSPVLAISADAIVDARLFAQLESDPASRVFESAADALEDERGVVLWLQSGVACSGASLSDAAHGLVASGAASLLGADEFSGYITMLRRDLSPYLFRIRDTAARKRVERFLFWSNYKGSTDFMTRYVYPPFVWVLLGPLARLRVHPNWVTAVDIVATFAAVPFFLEGEWVEGLLLAFLMSVLDSVDGKLARVSFTSSKLGEILDHGLDIVHPPIWYMAWGAALSGGVAGNAPWEASLWMLGFYIADRLSTMVFKWRHKVSIHGFTAFDERMRTFISRRNVNLPFFTVALAIDALRGDADWTASTYCFYAIVAWQVICTAFHVERVIQFWGQGGKR